MRGCAKRCTRRCLPWTRTYRATPAADLTDKAGGWITLTPIDPQPEPDNLVAPSRQWGRFRLFFVDPHYIVHVSVQRDAARHRVIVEYVRSFTGRFASAPNVPAHPQHEVSGSGRKHYLFFGSDTGGKRRSCTRSSRHVSSIKSIHAPGVRKGPTVMIAQFCANSPPINCYEG